VHVDPVAARRTLTGSRVVHGIHLALTVLEAVLGRSAGKRPDRALAGFTAQFLKPVLVGDVVVFYLSNRTAESWHVTGRIKEESVCQITVEFGPFSIRPNGDLPPLVHQPVAELSFEELPDRTGSLTLGLNPVQAHQLFPLTAAELGTGGIAATLALSRLVGMHCPGLHSIFEQAIIRYEGTALPGGLNYRVEQTDERFGRVILTVDGPGLQGQLFTFFRPPPESQPDMAAVTKVIEPGSFAESIALIIGGSRGLGEATAKIIAAGGGLAIITYWQGATDAERVAEDIRSQGGRCETLQFDVQSSQRVVRRLRKSKDAPRSIYYFATPRIFGRRRGFFSHDMLREFNEIYVTAFGKLLDAATVPSSTKLRVFYPSSVAVTEGMREMTEYAMAKRLAEEMCAFYNEHSKDVEIIVERLPRIKTDQTSTLVPFPAESAVDVMLSIVRRVEKAEQPGIPPKATPRLTS
jgi:short chain dehydrogenase/MaoC like domain